MDGSADKKRSKGMARGGRSERDAGIGKRLDEVSPLIEEGLEKIKLKEDPKGLNALYEDDWTIIGFHLKMSDVEKLLEGSSESTDKHTEIIRKKIKRGEIIKIPQGFISNEKIMSITENGKVDVYSKEGNEKVEHLLSGAKTSWSGEDSRSIDDCLCLPNGRIICCFSVGSLCGVYTPGKPAI